MKPLAPNLGISQRPIGELRIDSALTLKLLDVFGPETTIGDLSRYFKRKHNAFVFVKSEMPYKSREKLRGEGLSGSEIETLWTTLRDYLVKEAEL